MFKIIEAEGKFRVKEVDAEGNSVRMIDAEFTTQAEAQEFINENTIQAAGVTENTVSTDENTGVEEESPVPVVEDQTVPSENTTTQAEAQAE